MIQPTMGCFRLLLLWNTVGSRATRKLSPPGSRPTNLQAPR